jgi:hypothetical protein
MIAQLLIMLIGTAAAVGASQAAPPADLSAHIEQGRVKGRLISWCEGQFDSGHSKGYAAAVESASGGGRYVVLHEGVVLDLAPFKKWPDLSCYTPAAARKLNDSIRVSETISGRIVPVFSTTVVCAFIEETSAVCWQYSPKVRSFVKVGEWQT